MTVRTLVAWCHDWPVVAAGARPTEPVGVVRANRVVAASPAARAEGVRSGQRRREAQARCPALVVVGRDEAREAREFDPVVRAIESVTPRIEISRPGTCAFATRGPSRYFGGDVALAALVRDRIDAVLDDRSWAGHVGVGVADGPFAASIASRADRDGPMVVAVGAAAQFLAPHPVGVLTLAGVPIELVDVLVRLGLRTLGDFAGLDSADVVARFGVPGQTAHRLARGLDERPPATVTPPPELSVTAELDPPAERVDTAAFVAKTLADELHERLGKRGLACTRVLVVAETEHGERLERLWRHEGVLSAAAVAERVRWQLDGWLGGSAASRPTAGVSLLTLVPDEVVAEHGRQFGLWGGESEADVRAARALARVQGLLGPDAVVVPETSEGRGPADGVALVPLATTSRTTGDAVTGDAARRDIATGGRGGLAAPWPGRLPPPLPGRVHVPPLPAEVVDAAGEPVRVSGRGLVSAQPTRVAVTTGTWRTVDAWSAPWPVDERWWDPIRHRRRARLQVVTGGTALVLALEGGRWWLEATYD